MHWRPTCSRPEAGVGCFFVTANYIGTRGFVDAASIRDLDRARARRRQPFVLAPAENRALLRRAASRRMEPEPRHHLRHRRPRITAASVPGGDFHPAVAEAAADAGFSDLFTSEPATESRPAFGLTLHGRFIIRSWTPARTAAALAAGDSLPLAREALVWNVKKLGKRLGGERYLQIRRLLLGDGRQVQLGRLSRLTAPAASRSYKPSRASSAASAE